jgi:hypothetical protein
MRYDEGPDELTGLLSGTGWRLADIRTELYPTGRAYAALLTLG